jgi:hypothetical protein
MVNMALYYAQVEHDNMINQRVAENQAAINALGEEQDRDMQQRHDDNVHALAAMVAAKERDNATYEEGLVNERIAEGVRLKLNHSIIFLDLVAAKAEVLRAIIALKNCYKNACDSQSEKSRVAVRQLEIEEKAMSTAILALRNEVDEAGAESDDQKHSAKGAHSPQPAPQTPQKLALKTPTKRPIRTPSREE